LDLALTVKYANDDPYRTAGATSSPANEFHSDVSALFHDRHANRLMDVDSRRGVSQIERMEGVARLILQVRVGERCA